MRSKRHWLGIFALTLGGIGAWYWSGSDSDSNLHQAGTSVDKTRNFKGDEAAQATLPGGNSALTSASAATDTRNSTVPRLFGPALKIEGEPLDPSAKAFADNRLQGKVPVGRTATFAIADIANLGQLQKGQRIAIPLSDGSVVSGQVNLVRRDASGVVRVGGSLPDGHGSFSLGQDEAGIGGRVLLKKQGLAFVMSTPTPGLMQMRELALSEVICYPMPTDTDQPQLARLPRANPVAMPPELRSRPGATAVLYLDFDGESVTDPDWNDGITINAAASDLNNAQITEVWNRVKEDFWPFAINVTTVASDYANAPVGRRMRVIITPTDTWYPDAGGVAFRDTFSAAGTHQFTTDVPCWVFNWSVDGIAEAISHELGHTLGLSHDGRTAPAEEYYEGHGFGTVSWGPIMGAAYDSAVVQWSKGEYPGANNAQDDVAIISGAQATPLYGSSNATGYIADDAGNSRGSAVNWGTLSGPHGQSGIISSATDSDFYVFTLSSGAALSINANPANTYPHQANLDIQLELQDGGGNVLSSSNPDGALNASLTHGLSAGTYYVKVSGAGRAGGGVDHGYTSYGSIGAYTLNASLAVPVAPQITGEHSSLNSAPGAYSQFSVTASGTAPLAYRWQRLANGSGSWVDLNESAGFSGTQTGALVVLGMFGMNGDQFRCVVTNSVGSATSNPATLSVATELNAVSWLLYSFPSSGATGSVVSGTVTVMNAGSQAWGANHRVILLDPSSVVVATASLSGIAPGQSSTVTLNFNVPVTPYMSYSYTLRAEEVGAGWFGTPPSFAFSTYGAAVPPNIITHPVSQSIDVGGSISFTVVAVGQVPLSYQWQHNGSDIPGATAASLTISNVQLADAGNYTVTVTNPLGSVSSNPANLTVGIPPGVVSALAAQYFTVFLRADGSRWVLGDNHHGEFGNGTSVSSSFPLRTLSNVATIGSWGEDYHAFVKTDGTLWASGRGLYTMAGLATEVPVAVQNGTNVAEVALNGYFVRTDGTLWVNGTNGYGQLGNGTSSHQQMPLSGDMVPFQTATEVATVASGRDSTLFVKADGTVWGVGNMNTGYIRPYPVPEGVPYMMAEDVDAVTAFGPVSTFLKPNGQLWVHGLDGQPMRLLAANVVRASSSGASVFFIKDDATLWAVGSNYQGRLGDGTTTDRSTPVQIASGVFDVSAGWAHTVFVRNDGSLWGMGRSDEWQIGSQSGGRSQVPVLLASGNVLPPAAPTGLVASDGSLTGTVRISWDFAPSATKYEIWRASTNSFAQAVKIGTVYSRRLFYDRVGLDSSVHFYWVKAVNPGGASLPGPSDSGHATASTMPLISQQPASASHQQNSYDSTTFAVSATGSGNLRYTWQEATPGSITWTSLSETDFSFGGVHQPTLVLAREAADVRHGYRFRCIVTNLAGQVTSNEATLAVVNNAPQISFQSGDVTVNVGSGAAFSAGVYSLTPLTYQWRKDGVDIPGATDNSYQLSNVQPASAGQYSVRATNAGGSVVSVPITLTVADPVEVIASAAGWDASAFLRSDHSLWAMGYVTSDLTGAQRLVTGWPSMLATDVDQVAAGAHFLVWIKSDGTLWRHGRDFPYGAPIYSTSTYSIAPLPIHVASNVRKVTAGSDHIAFIKTDGTLWTMGQNPFGELGIAGEATATPVQIATGVADVAVTDRNTYFIKQDGALWATGYNYWGQIGDGTTTNRPAPVSVATGVARVSGGGRHAVFLKQDGTLWGMGTNLSGEMGPTVSGQQAAPVQLESDVTGVMAGPGLTFYTKVNGSTWAMGDNTTGRRGDGVPATATPPVPVPAFDLGKSSVSINHAMFVRSNGSLWAVGANHSAQLGIGLTPYKYSQQFVTGGSSAFLATPQFTQQPLAQNKPVGGNASFGVAASGAPVPTYRWQRLPAGSGVWADISNGGVFSGATTANLAITGATLAMSADQYRCVATNVAGSATSAPAALTVINLTEPQFGRLQKLHQSLLQRTATVPELNVSGTALANGATTFSNLYDDLLALPEYQSRRIETVIRLYYAGLGRAPDYAGVMYWSELLRTGAQTPAQVGTGFAGSPEFQATYGSLTDTQFIELMYQNVLGRPAEADGLAYWLSQLNTGTTRGAVLAGFADATEFVERMHEQVEVIRLHVLLYGRVPSATELANWLGFLHGEELTEIFLDSPEFASLYPSGLTDSQYVNAMFQGFMRRGVDSAGLSYFTNQLGTGATTRARLLNSLVKSTEFEETVAPVARMYFACLQRPADLAGLDYWTNYVRSGNTLQAFADGIAASPEFGTRYGSLNNTQYIQQIYLDVLGRAADSTGLAYWQNRLGTGADTRASMLLGFTNASETVDRFANRVFTHLHYLTFLNNRQATTGEFNFWDNYLIIIEYKMREEFIESAEFDGI